MTKSFSRLCCAVLLAFSLTACLPGEKKAEKVIEQTKVAGDNVQAEKIAADMGQAAKQLLASLTTNAANAVATSNDDLVTVSCGTNSAMAFIPTTAKITRNGAVPLPLATRMRNELETKFKNSGGSVTTATSSSVTGCVTNTALIAVNSPVLVIHSNLAAMQETAQDDSQIASVNMTPCAGGQPGIVVTKTFKNGTTQTVPHCGAAAPSASQLPNITLANNGVAMPNWKSQLLNNIAATENFTCFSQSGSSSCNPLPAPSTGIKVTCDDDSEKQEFIANPTFNATTYQFKPDVNVRSCGKGWTGTLISRIKKKDCTITNSNGTQAQPATVFDVAYVGAECQKDKILLSDACPAGYPLSSTGKMIADKDISMKAPITLQPHPTNTKGVNTSDIPYYRGSAFSLSGVQTNMSSDIIQLTQSGPLPVKMASQAGQFTLSGTVNKTLFASKNDLTAAPADDQIENTFDARFTQEIANANKANVTAKTCYGAAQTCTSGAMPEMVAVVVDRSGSMMAQTPPVIRRDTFCRATMRNMFKDQGGDVENLQWKGCVAAREWQNLIKPRPERAGVMSGWDYNQDPVTYGANTAYEALRNILPGNQQTLLDEKLATMTGSLIDPSYTARLKYTLAIGEDCYPLRPVGNTMKAVVRDDMYGSCAPVFANDNQLAAALYDQMPLRSCQSTCPGECVTDAQKRNPAFTPNPSAGQIYPTAANVPVPDPNPNRAHTIDEFVRSNLISNLPVGAKFFYMEFRDGEIDRDGDSDASRRPVFMWLADAAGQQSVIPAGEMKDTDKAAWQLKLKKAMALKFQQTEADIGGGTPLYESIDPAIDKLRNEVLNNYTNPKFGPNAPAALAIMTDGDDTGTDSYYFGHNVCQKETKPQKFQCKKHVGGIFGIGGHDEYLDVDQNAVRNQYGAESLGTRQSWCSDQGYNKPVVKIDDPSGDQVQYDSMVGFIGRNYPNTKVYYLDIGNGTTVGNDCTGDNAFYTAPDGTRKKVLSVFQYSDSAGDELYKGFNAVTGGNGVAPEAAQKICGEVYGTSTPVSMEIPPNAPLPPLNADTALLPSCQGAKWMDVTSTPGQNGVEPPVFVPGDNSSGDNGNPYGNGPGQCVGGFDRTTMEVCGG